MDEAATIRTTGVLCEAAGSLTVRGSGAHHVAGSEEEEPVLFLQGTGTALAAQGQTTLVNVNIAAGGEATLTLINRAGLAATLEEEPRSGNSLKFSIVTTTCFNNILILNGRGGNSCTIRIRREAGAALSDVVPISIRYRLALDLLPVTESFNVRAT